MANKAILVGNVGQDPEIRHNTAGEPIANISLATSEKWTNKDGEKQEKTEWHRIVIFGKLADVVQKYVKKGDKLYIEGKIQTRKWEKDGIARYSTEIVLDFGGKMEMLGSKGDSTQTTAPSQATIKPVAVDSTLPDIDSEIPF